MRLFKYYRMFGCIGVSLQIAMFTCVIMYVHVYNCIRQFVCMIEFVPLLVSSGVRTKR